MKLAQVFAVALAATLSAVALTASAQVMVGGAPMYSNKDIIDNAVNSKDHTTLVAAVKAAGLVQTLKDRGHRVSELEMTSGAQAIVRDKDANGRPRWAGAADPRREGAALGD